MTPRLSASLARKGSAESGHSLMEVTIGIAIMGLLVLFVTFFASKATESGVIASNSEFRMTLLKNANEIVQKAAVAPSLGAFDPATTLVPNASAYQPAGVWRVDGTAADITTADTQSFPMDALALKQDSHLLHVYRLTEATGSMAKETVHVLISRCVDSSELATPTALTDILALRRPVLIAGQIHCCDNLSSCPNASSTEKKYWPTIFVYKAAGKVQTMPTSVERAVVPGVGFMVYLNKQTNPELAHYSVFMLENRCKSTNVGFGERAPTRCSKTMLGKPIDSYFDSDTVVKSIMEQSRGLSSDFSGSGFIKL